MLLSIASKFENNTEQLDRIVNLNIYDFNNFSFEKTNEGFEMNIHLFKKQSDDIYCFSEIHETEESAKSSAKRILKAFNLDQDENLKLIDEVKFI